MDKNKKAKTPLEIKWDWERYILNAEPKLSKGCTKSTLIAYCFAMAMKGTNGLGCYASDARIARELDKRQAKLVRPYRHEALRLGWFVWNGEMEGRSQKLDIAIPEVVESAGQRITDNMSVIPEDAKHTADVSPLDCSACQPLLRMVDNADMTVEQLTDIHYGT